MPTFAAVSFAFLEGLFLGLLFFGGLWFTVRALPESRFPTALAVGSFWVRTAVVVAGFLFVIPQGWRHALICLVGFVAARLLMTRRLPATHHQTPTTG